MATTYAFYKGYSAISSIRYPEEALKYLDNYRFKMETEVSKLFHTLMHKNHNEQARGNEPGPFHKEHFKAYINLAMAFVEVLDEVARLQDEIAFTAYHGSDKANMNRCNAEDRVKVMGADTYRHWRTARTHATHFAGELHTLWHEKAKKNFERQVHIDHNWGGSWIRYGNHGTIYHTTLDYNQYVAERINGDIKKIEDSWQIDKVIQAWKDYAMRSPEENCRLANANTLAAIALTKETNSDCHTAVPGDDDCYPHVYWAMTTGIVLHPDWYPGLSASSYFPAFQSFLAGNYTPNCPQPC